MTPPIRVTHIIKVILIAGAERHLLALLPALQAHNVHSSLLLLTPLDKPMPDYIAAAAALGIPVVQETIHRHLDPTLFGRVRARLQALAPDVVHTHLLHADLYGVLAARSLGIRAVVTSRHNDNAFRWRWASRLLHRALWSQTAQGIAISDAIRDFCINIEGASAAKLHTVHYGISPEVAVPSISAARAALRAHLGLPPDAVILGTMCRLIEQKGIAFAIQAFEMLHTEYPHVHLVITGEGALRAQLEGLVDALDLGERVHFLGWQPEPTHILAAYDVLLMPSLWEGFGLVMLEAMAQGVPIIGSRVSAIPEVIDDGYSGILVPPKDPHSLARAITYLLDHPQKRLVYGEHARERLIQHFSTANMARQVRGIYDAALGH